jgi:hypothetical protein
VSYAPGIFTITKLALTITASSPSLTYGDPAPAITASYSGFAPGETSAVLTSAPTCTTAYTATSAAGTTPATTCSGAVATNYTFSYVAGAVTIAKKAATVTAGSGTKAAGAADPALTTTSSGFTAADLPGITLTTTRAMGEAVGTYATTATAAGGNVGNYTVSFTPGTFTITAPAVTTWSGSGPGVVTVADNGSTGHPQMSYIRDLRVPPVTGTGGGVPLSSWEFSTAAASAGTVNLAWAYSGFHAYFQVTVRLDVFVRHLGVETIVSTPVNAGPINCCTPPSGGFGYSGNASVVVQAGDTYGFKLRGSNGDSNSVLQGTITIGISAPSPLPELADSASIAAGHSPVAEDAENWRADRFRRPSPDRARRSRVGRV